MSRGERTHILLRVGAQVAWQMTRLGGRKRGKKEGNRVILTVDHVCNWRGEEGGVSWNRRREKKNLCTHPPQCVREPKFSFWLDVTECGKKAMPTQKWSSLVELCQTVREDHHPPFATAGQVAVVVEVVAERGFQTVEIAGGSVWW